MNVQSFTNNHDEASVKIEMNDPKQLEDRFQLDTYAKLPISVEKGRGCSVFDEKGTEYLDLYGGHCVCSTGHCHSRVVEAIQKQTAELIFYSNATYNSVRGRALAKLAEFCEPGKYQAFLANSGAEANENAIKMARALTGRTIVLSTENSFHGRTYGSLSATGIQKYRDYLNTPVPGHSALPVEEVPRAVTEETAAVLIEPIQSMSGVEEISIEALKEIEDACRAKGALVIFDEIQTGVGRTGSFLFSQQLGVSPDLTSLAKGIASGYPAAVLLVSENISGQVKKGDLGSTFGGNPVACAAMHATLEVLEEEDLISNAAVIGSYLKRKLRELDGVKEVRGRGLLLGIGFKKYTAREVQAHLIKNHILAGTSNNPEILRLMPPLTLSHENADQFIEVLREL
jgi:acetylornithine aminotransferase/acetylornithine/N-succinyldiaminopimelate aminotransferase